MTAAVDLAPVASDTRSTVAAYVAEHPAVGPRQIADSTGLAYETVKKTVARMAAAGQLVTDGAGRYSPPAPVAPPAPAAPPAQDDAAALARLDEHLSALTLRQTGLRAVLRDTEAARRAALVAGDDTTELARQARNLREDLAALAEDEHVVQGWAAPLRASLLRARHVADAERLSDELAAAETACAQWVAEGLAAFTRPIPALVADVPGLVTLAAGARPVAERYERTRQQLAMVCGQLGVPGPPAGPDLIERVAQQLPIAPPRRQLFLSAIRGDRAAMLSVLAALERTRGN